MGKKEKNEIGPFLDAKTAKQAAELLSVGASAVRVVGRYLLAEPSTHAFWVTFELPSGAPMWRGGWSP